MPDIIGGNNAQSPDHERHRGGRPHERQQPEQGPWIYDWSKKKECCYWQSKGVHRPFRGFSSHPDRGKKADEHCQPSHNLWSRHSLERCKHRIIKAESLHVSAERADRNPAVVEKWYI